MPRYRLYTHEKNEMRQFTNVGKWYFRQLGIPPGNPSDDKVVCKACYKRLQRSSTREKSSEPPDKRFRSPSIVFNSPSSSQPCKRLRKFYWLSEL